MGDSRTVPNVQRCPIVRFRYMDKDLVNDILGITRLYSAQLISQWLLLLRSGMEMWTSIPEQATQAVRAVDRELTQDATAINIAEEEEEEKEQTEDKPEVREVSLARAQNRDDHDRYQRELIRLDAHQIWLRRKQQGVPGDAVSDWVTAEHRYNTRG